MTSHEISPLRYPGGKGGLAPFLGRLIEDQERRPAVYVEPFAGGAGAALRLLFDEYVDHVVLNDLDRGVAAFWRSLRTDSEELARLIECAEVSLESWHSHRDVYQLGSASDLELGFSTFFLNRTNRSGILDARPIGGLGQLGPWKIDARFNRASLASRVRLLGRYRNRITVSEDDGVEVVSKYLGPRTFVYADPPYLTRGADLYLNAMTWTDHRRMAAALSRSRGMWMVTYDHDPRVPELYAGLRRAEFSIAHTAAKPHIGREYAVFGSEVALRSLEGLGRDPVLVHESVTKNGGQ